MKMIVINNPAAKTGGAITILVDFLKKIGSLKCDRKFLVIVSSEELKKYETDKIKIIVIETQNFFKRIIWDNFKLKSFLKKQNICSNLFISLQNTGVNLDKEIPQIIYYHQALSLSNYKWDFFKKDQRIYWMYRYIYPIFIKMYLKRVKKIIVQTEWIKDSFSKKFFYPKEDIILIRPELSNIKVKDYIKKKQNKVIFFYPASLQTYKNHGFLLKIFGELNKENPKLLNGVEIILTIENTPKVRSLINYYNIENYIKLVGNLNYESILKYYGMSDVMIFPSSIESLGLPLLEAQQFGLDIIVIDLPYSREVTSEYEKVKLIDKLDKFQWKSEILTKIKKIKEEKNEN
ncbi:glycosyltransferase [Cetobacterium sp.]|uniref:glycosyltransferase n=1 Tax=Cetobacterium sp. TaxID=2071632 RepID=UPI003EE55E1A